MHTHEIFICSFYAQFLTHFQIIFIFCNQAATKEDNNGRSMQQRHFNNSNPEKSHSPNDILFETDPLQRGDPTMAACSAILQVGSQFGQVITNFKLVMQQMQSMETQINYLEALLPILDKNNGNLDQEIMTNHFESDNESMLPPLVDEWDDSDPNGDEFDFDFDFDFDEGYDEYDFLTDIMDLDSTTFSDEDAARLLKKKNKNKSKKKKKKNKTKNPTNAPTTMQPTPLPTSTPNKLITQKPTTSSRSVCLATFTTGCLDNSNAECCSGICGIDRFNVDHCICKASTTGDDGECKNPGQEDPVCCSNYCGSSGNCECAPQSATCIPNFGAENVSVQQCCGDLTCSELGVCVSPTARPTSFPTPDVTSSPTTSGCTPLSACSGSSGSVGIGGCLGGSSCIGKSGSCYSNVLFSVLDIDSFNMTNWYVLLTQLFSSYSCAGNVGAGSCQGIDSCSLSLGDIGEYSCFGPSSCVENAGYISGGSW